MYEDGSIGLGPVPTASGDGTAPVDPDGFNFGAAMNALLNNEHEKEEFGVEDEDETAVRFENVEISLSPFALMNLWAMALLALCVNGVLIVRCMMKRFGGGFVDEPASHWTPRSNRVLWSGC